MGLACSSSCSAATSSSSWRICLTPSETSALTRPCLQQVLSIKRPLSQPSPKHVTSMLKTARTCALCRWPLGFLQQHRLLAACYAAHSAEHTTCGTLSRPQGPASEVHNPGLVVVGI